VCVVHMEERVAKSMEVTSECTSVVSLLCVIYDIIPLADRLLVDLCILFLCICIVILRLLALS